MAEFADHPYLFAAVALAIAGFDVPDNEASEPEAADDFELLYAVNEGLELAIVFQAQAQTFDIEIQIASCTEATRTAALLLARAVEDLRCTLLPDGQVLALSRQVTWDADTEPEDFAAAVAELVAAGQELMGATSLASSDDPGAAYATGVIRG